jgi:1-acyl-sn-glycerol-3-phosphate acyltransferase
MPGKPPKNGAEKNGAGHAPTSGESDASGAEAADAVWSKIGGGMGWLNFLSMGSAGGGQDGKTGEESGGALEKFNGIYCVVAIATVLTCFAYTAVVLVLILPLKYVSMEAHAWLRNLVMQLGWSPAPTLMWIAKIRLRCARDPASFRFVGEGNYFATVASHGKYVMNANHQSFADTFVLALFLYAKGLGNGSAVWTLYEGFKNWPLGCSSRMAGHLFVGKSTRDAGVDLSHFGDGYQGLIIFSEGLCFNQERKLTSQEFARSRGLPVLERVLVPRTGTLQLALPTLEKHGIASGYFVDVTVAYPVGSSFRRSATSLMDILSIKSEPITISLLIKVYPGKELLGKTRDELEKYLVDVSVKKDKALAAYEETGGFPGEEDVQQQPFWLIAQACIWAYICLSVNSLIKFVLFLPFR